MTPLADRPLIAKLLAVPEYLERYHGFIRELVEGDLEPAAFAARARAVHDLLDPFVARGPTKFVTYEQFQASLERGTEPAAQQQGPGMGGSSMGLLTFVEQRVANVVQQLDGTLPSSGDGSGMGASSFGGPGQGGGFPGQQGGVQPPGGFQPPGDGGQFPPGEAGGRGGFPGAQAPGPASPSSVSAFGVPADQVVPVGVAVLLLMAATGMVWRLRPR